MARTVAVYALALAALVFALEWIEYRYVTRTLPAGAAFVLVGLGFAALGVWAGVALTRRDKPGPFAVNTAAQASLGLTERELSVLVEIALGHSNKEIARNLGVSPNTIKTHLGHLFAKLEVSRRGQAILKGRQLGLIP